MDMKTTSMKSKRRNSRTTTRTNMRSVLPAAVNSLLLLVVLASCAMLGGCAVRESAFRVRGKIETVSNSEPCTMEVYRADTSALVSKKNIRLEFQETVVTAPGKHKYYLTISCPDSSITYKSPVYEFGTAEQFQHPLDLGTISLKPKGH
jgi:hypothetical protein